MPNWCENELTLKGKKKDIIEFLDYKKDAEKFLFNNYLPIPQTYIDYDTTNKMLERDSFDWDTKEPNFKSDEEYKEYCEGYKNAVEYQKNTYGVVGWYDWRIANYGTKWDLGNYSAPLIKDLKSELNDKKDDEDTSITLYFDTAWSPCIPFIENIYQNFPNIKFSLGWLEIGCSSAGLATFWCDDEGPYSDIEYAEPELFENDSAIPLTEERRIEIEKENGYDDWEGIGVLYDYRNPLLV